MLKKFEKKAFCQISNKKFPISELVPANYVREGVVNLIKKQYPDWDENGYIEKNELNKFRKEYIKYLLESEKGELDYLEKEVLKKIHNAEFLAKNINEIREETLTLGDRVADKVARFGGSWIFIFSFFVFIILWIIVNALVLVFKPFDPYPFILLNLLLSCLAAIQAPIIMMSQNRQESKDRIRSEHDYQINLKAEMEIRLLHEKIDHLLLKQSQNHYEIEKIQLDYLEDISDLLKNIMSKQDEKKC